MWAHPVQWNTLRSCNQVPHLVFMRSLVVIGLYLTPTALVSFTKETHLISFLYVHMLDLFPVIVTSTDCNPSPHAFIILFDSTHILVIHTLIIHASEIAFSCHNHKRDHGHMMYFSGWGNLCMTWIQNHLLMETTLQCFKNYVKETQLLAKYYGIRPYDPYFKQYRLPPMMTKTTNDPLWNVNRNPHNHMATKVVTIASSKCWRIAMFDSWHLKQFWKYRLCSKI